MIKNLLKTITFLLIINTQLCFAYDNSLKNKAFPELKGKNILGEPIKVPSNKISLVILGFSRESSNNLESWGKSFEKKYSNTKKLDLYLIPMLGNNPLLKVIGGMIEGSTKKTYSPNLHKNIMVFYENLEPIKKYLNYQSNSDTYAYLLDENGKIIWLAKGNFNYDSFNSMEKVLEKL